MRVSMGSEARELLQAAAGSEGVIYRIETDQSPTFIRSDGRDFIDKRDSAIASAYVEAVAYLCTLGYAEFKGGSLYELIGTGWQ